MIKENLQKVWLKAGILDMLYLDGTLRYIKSGKTEIIRMIYPALRDSEWLNVEGIRSNEIVEAAADSFTITYNIKFSRNEIALEAKVVITGNPDSSIIYRFEAEALNSFMKNRVGLCVLHPVEPCAGKPCTIIKPDNKSESTEFPLFISAHQPFTDIKSIIWKAGWLDCCIDFSGALFETEDQRNWTDDSFKTYSTPLSLPYPARMDKGERIVQELKLSVAGEAEKISVSDTINIIAGDKEALRFPSIGICRTSGQEKLTRSQAESIKETGFDHYRIELDLTKEGWQQTLNEAVAEAEMLALSVELALFFDDNAVEQCAELIEKLTEVHCNILLFIIYHKYQPATPDELSDALIPLLKNAFPGVKAAAGTNANFAQLNRNRPSSVQPDLICWSIHPQEHASDYLTLVENLKAQAYTVQSAVTFSEGKPFWVSPVTIARRFNANLGFHNDVNKDNPPPEADMLLRNMKGACWVAASVKYLAESGVAGISLLETTGNSGIINTDSPGLNSNADTGLTKYPVFNVLRYLMLHKGFKIIPSISTDRLSVEAIILTDNSEMRALLINLTEDLKEVRIGFGTGLKISSLIYDDPVAQNRWSVVNITDTAENNLDHNLKLRPFSITFITGNT